MKRIFCFATLLLATSAYADEHYGSITGKNSTHLILKSNGQAEYTYFMNTTEGKLRLVIDDKKAGWGLHEKKPGINQLGVPKEAKRYFWVSAQSLEGHKTRHDFADLGDKLIETGKMGPEGTLLKMEAGAPHAK